MIAKGSYISKRQPIAQKFKLMQRERIIEEERKALSILKKIFPKVIFQKAFVGGPKIYIVDFYIPKPYKIIFEVDGLYHSTRRQIEKDELRDVWLESKGYKIIRVNNEDVSYEHIKKALFDINILLTMAKNPFIIPTIEEISAFMKLKKKEWPKAFCNWYAEKFFHNYTSSGWKLSAGRGGQMKSWQSAFQNNWKMLKYPEDLAMLKTLTPKPKPVDYDTLDYMNEMLAEYRSGVDCGEIRMASCYDWCKEQGFFKKMSDENRSKGIEISKTDLTKAKAFMVNLLFESMVKQLITFNYYFNEVSA